MYNNNLVNYEIKTSSSNNYELNQSSSTPESFPNLIGAGFFVEYRNMNYTSDFLDDNNLSNQETSK
jgi:hypothetical protein